MGAGEALRRVLECLASGIVMPGWGLVLCKLQGKDRDQGPEATSWRVPLTGLGQQQHRVPLGLKHVTTLLHHHIQPCAGSAAVTQGGSGTVVTHSHVSSLL